jgi:hypothetical protein
MKKTILKILGAATCMAALLVNVSLTGNQSSKNVDLKGISVATEANAECVGFTYFHGKCLTLLQVCVFDTEREACDPYHP